MNLVLTGYRCTGKTTIGGLLADRLGRPLVDTDGLVQQRAGKSIREIVSEGGWPAFRRLEREAVADVSAADGQVISAGGGAVLDEANVRALRATGRVVLLSASAEVIWDRMKADAKTAPERPDLTDTGGLAEVRRLLGERRAAYQGACHVEVPTDHLSPGDVAGRILEWFQSKK